MVRRSPNGFGISNNGRVARAIYRQSVLPTLTPEDHGKYLCIDCDTGKWELAEDEPTAKMRVWRANPTGRNRVGVQIGYADQDAAGGDDNENVFLPPFVEKSPGEISPGEIEYR